MPVGVYRSLQVGVRAQVVPADDAVRKGNDPERRQRGMFLLEMYKLKDVTCCRITRPLHLSPHYNRRQGREKSGGTRSNRLRPAGIWLAVFAGEHSTAHYVVSRSSEEYCG